MINAVQDTIKEVDRTKIGSFNGNQNLEREISTKVPTCAVSMA